MSHATIPSAHTLLDEQLVRLTASPAVFERCSSVRPSLRTVWRWASRGTRVGKLETCMVGGLRYTSEEAIQRFLEAGQRPFGTPPQTPTNRRRDREIARAERELGDF